MKAKETKLDLMLHPVRMRILQTMLGGKERTVQQIAEFLPDIPQATLYRHLNRLVKGELITIVGENPIRGTVERVYKLTDSGIHISAEELKNASREDHERYFMAFLSNVFGEYHQYLQQDQLDLEKDGVGYRQFHLYMDDDEYSEFVKGLGELIQRVIKNEPSSGRRRRTLATIIFPEQEVTEND